MATSDDKTEPKKTAPAKSTGSAAAPEQTTGNTQGADDKQGGGVRAEVTASREARLTVPGADNVDARLDNRTGADRPKIEQWPAKPQQIDGPDVLHQAEHTRRVLAEREAEDTSNSKGMFSPGPHGLGDESLREGGPAGKTETLYGTEGLTEAEMPGGSPKAGG